VRGEELLMIPLRERLHQVSRKAWGVGDDDEDKGAAKKNKKSKKPKPQWGGGSGTSTTKRRPGKATGPKVAGSFFEAEYKVKNPLLRKKLLTEIKVLLAVRRKRRRTLRGKFDVTKWAQIDVVDWLHFDVKLPQFTDQFIAAQLDGMTLRDGLTASILKYELGIRQKRHRRKIMAAIELLRTGEPLLSPRQRRRAAKRGAGAGQSDDNGNGGMSLSNELSEAEGEGGDDQFTEEDDADELSKREKRRLEEQLLGRLRRQVEAELKGINHGEQLMSMQGLDVDNMAWEFGLESPTAKSLKMGKQPQLPRGPDETQLLLHEEETEATSAAADGYSPEEARSPGGRLQLKLNGAAGGGDEDEGLKEPPVLIPRHSPVPEMLAVLQTLAGESLEEAVQSGEMNSGGRNSVAGFLWQRMIENMEPAIAQREGGVTFQEFPTALQGAMNVVIRNQMQALFLFRALDVDGDGIISKTDCTDALQAGNSGGGGAQTSRSTTRSRSGAATSRSDRSSKSGGAASPGTRARVMQKDIVLADRYLAAVSDSLDRQRTTVKGIFASVVRQSGRGG
jgi:hypothetical protein